ncbi:MAG: hypothetical protein H6767_06770 [Candidatus Peribacteria bacterium]|nr:MAG: hypothetical protein H6767_06770 [Candidatus Peribacteria bacterium]
MDHDISLVTSEGKEIFISENAPFSLQAFSFIQLTEFLKTYTDSAWFSENKDFDTQLLQALQDNLLASLSSSTLSKSMSTWFGDSDQIVSLIQK